MARYEVTAPDGTKWEVTAPEGADQRQVLEYAKNQWSARQQAAPAAPETKNNTIASQMGLTARAGIQAAGGFAGLIADPIGGVYNAIAPAGAPRMQTARSMAVRGADALGLPSPDTPLQRIVAQGNEFMAGAAAPVRLAGAVANAAAPRGVTNQVASRLADDPIMQMTAAGAGGAGGQQAKEMGADATGELISALGGTVGGAGVVAGLRGAKNGLLGLIPQRRDLEMSKVQSAIADAMQRGRIDPATITPAMQSMLQEQAKAALRKGPLNTDALARLADYARLNMTPTRARLTLDPYDVTQEQNASRMAAALGARDAKLPAISQGNNQRLMSLTDDLGPSADRFALGERAKAPIIRADQSMKAGEGVLYDNARQMAGGDIPLQRAPLNAVYDKLSKERKLRFVPEEVMGTIDDILNDTRAPFTVNEVDSLKTVIATAQRGAKDGNVKAALKIVRDHLDSMPLTPDKKTFGGNQVVTEKGAQYLQQQDAQAGAVKAALDKARAAAAKRRNWQESSPMIEDALADATAETFIQKHVLSPSAGFKSLSKAALVADDPNAREAVRSAIAQHLKDAAIGKGNEAATGNFSGRGWMQALSGIGDRKLGLFFDASEIEQLKAMGRTGTAEVFQPRGSAVNNSNTAAGVAGLLQGVSKFVKPLAGKLPLGNELLSNPLDNITLSMMQRGAGNVPNALLMQQPVRRGALDQLLIPGLSGVNLLSQ